ncbi:hypothetical protein CDL12_18946 [Handroanthus impetiginosus]|uniref:Neprosin PEP catalytic domain-containing protein n=1 Tax=Handroanthus impetiginosus TaxID=429701 RepID=A0A2G9GT89_9LAMI|nr:hypothetical protein CDL12_18946 [Handroanthus impetiginosus]
MRPDSKILATLGHNISKRKNHLVGFNFWKSKKGCPKGTVPIQRTQMMNNQRKYSRDGLSHLLKWNHGLDFAGIYSKPGQTFYGASGLINIYNPKLHGPNQYSSVAIFLASGKDLIEAGWTSDYYLSTGCYNALCPGFVVVNNEIPFGFVFNDTSVIERKQYEEYFSIYLEPGVGWWLHVRDASVAIGYWPISWFGTMQHSTTHLFFGGEVYTPLSDDESPQMGSGKFVDGQYDKTCYMRQVSILNKDYQIVDVDNSYMAGYDSRCYYSGDNSFKNDVDRYSFVFGGRGGKDESTCVY